MTAPAERTKREIDLLLTALESSRARFLSAMARLEPETVDAPVAVGRWSPLQYLEHLVRAEEVVMWRMFGAVDAARRGNLEVRSSPTPYAPVEDIINRTWKPRESAPPLAVPTLGGSREYWMVRMRRNEALGASFVEWAGEVDFNQVAFRHPISGPFTLRQGIEFLRYHIDRHLGHVVHGGDTPGG